MPDERTGRGAASTPPAAQQDLSLPERPAPPSELVDFLQQPEPRTLLVVGQPGAGKTTLSLSLLSVLDRPSYFISTRVGRGNLLRHFPWLVGTLSPDRLIDVEDIRPVSDRQEDLLHLLDRLTDTVDPLTAGHRLREFLSFPEPFARALGEPPVKAGHRVLFVDSYEGLVEPYLHLLGLDELARSSLEHGLLSLFHAAGFSLVLCSEGSTPHQLHYLADGVVELRAEPCEAGLLRHMELRKLRGSPILHARIAFSLEGGRFTVCPPLPRIRGVPPRLMRPAPAAPAPSGGLLLGIPALDRELGGVEAGETILAEMDGRGTSTPLVALLYPFWLRALQDGWTATLLMDLGHRPGVVTRAFQEALGGGDLAKRLRILPLPGRTSAEELWQDLLASFQPRSAVDVSVRSLSALLSEDGEALTKRLGRLQVHARESQSILVLVSGAPNALLPVLSTMVPVHLTLRNYYGTFVISGSHPPTANYAVLVNDHALEGPYFRYVRMI